MLLVVATACGGPSGGGGNGPSKDGPAKEGGTLDWLVVGEPPTLNPKGYTGALVPQYSALYDSLVQVDPKSGDPIFRQAESVTPNENKSVWTIKLREGLKFSDGTAFNAEAIKAWWDHEKVPANASPVISTLTSFKSYTVEDALTLQVDVGYPRAALYNDLAFTSLGMIPSPAVVESSGDAFGSSVETFAAAGPFVLKEWVQGDHMTLVANKDYWDEGRPYLDGITFKLSADASTNADAVVSGAADMAYQPFPDPAEQRVTDAGGQHIFLPDVQQVIVSFNVAKAPFDDVRVRRALVLATDPKDISDKAQSGLATPVTTLFPEGSSLYDPAVVQKTNDLEQAQELIDEYLQDTGKDSITGSVLSPDNQAADQVSALTQNWNRLDNVDISIDKKTVAAYVSARGAKDFDMVISNSADPGTFVEEWLNKWSTGGAANTQNYSDPELDKLLEAGRGYADQDERKKALNEIGARLMEEAAFVGLTYAQKSVVASNEVRVDAMINPSVPDPAQISIG
ncbi:ABC transporter substrate-binding protein [Nocardioides sp. Root190]|uniref:ABC transporter substrate-binding protein n=1 Tax=Nocardioides sp. Root190 TaxID=1736488 RepID=UPI00138F3D25|nr:ABC transporter substrate-binding protein [Nocardioides sp. Root190]